MEPEAPSAVRSGSAAPVLVLAALAVLAAIAVDPVAGLGVFGVGALLLYRPFDPFWAAVLTAGVASFVNNEGGRLTFELGIVSLCLVYTFTSLVLAQRLGLWRMPNSALVLPLLGWLGVSTASAAHGVLAGHPLRYLGLEYLPVVVTGLALVVGGLDLDASRLRAACRFLLVVAAGHILLGLWSYKVNHTRTGGIWYTPIPGMMACFGLAGALAARRTLVRWSWMLFTAACLLVQLISFSRGYWIALMVALPLLVARWVGRDAGARERLREVWGLTLRGGAVVLVAFVAFAIANGWTDIAGLVLTRFSSSTGTGFTGETASNFARLLEYGVAMRHLRAAPLFGHGLGMEMTVHYPVFERTSHQWYMHEAYFEVLVKQGIVGLLAWAVLLFAAVRLAWGAARDRNDAVWPWTAATAAATVYLAVLDLTSFHMHQVNTPTLEAVWWGIVISRTRSGSLRLAWARPVAREPRPAA